MRAGVSRYFFSGLQPLTPPLLKQRQLNAAVNSKTRNQILSFLRIQFCVPRSWRFTLLGWISLWDDVLMGDTKDTRKDKTHLVLCIRLCTGEMYNRRKRDGFVLWQALRRDDLDEEICDIDDVGWVTCRIVIHFVGFAGLVEDGVKENVYCTVRVVRCGAVSSERCKCFDRP